MNARKLRILIPLAVLVLAGIGFAAHTGFGSLSAVGWESVSVLCPLGALGTMLASRTMVPRAVVSLVVALVAIVIFGRAFCGWICPVPVVSKLRTAFSKQPKDAETGSGSSGSEAEACAGAKDAGKAAEAAVAAAAETDAADAKAAAETDAAAAKGAVGKAKALSKREQEMLHASCAHGACVEGCRPSNSRNLVLGGALLSAAIFGFPVFCLICPIGLTFALVFVLINLFGAGDLTWSVVVIPALLLVEVVFFRKWCSHLCPLSALMSLVGKANRTLRPAIDDASCIEVRGGECGRCGQVCEVGIDPRHPERGASWSECTKCRACLDACPGNAISMPFLPKASVRASQDEPLQPSQ